MEQLFVVTNSSFLLPFLGNSFLKNDFLMCDNCHLEWWIKIFFVLLWRVDIFLFHPSIRMNGNKKKYFVTKTWRVDHNEWKKVWKTVTVKFKKNNLYTSFFKQMLILLLSSFSAVSIRLKILICQVLIIYFKNVLEKHSYHEAYCNKKNLHTLPE